MQTLEVSHLRSIHEIAEITNLTSVSRKWGPLPLLPVSPTSEGEQVDADCPGKNGHDDDNVEDDGVEDEIWQGTYGMGEY